jgi:hypothetical protein
MYNFNLNSGWGKVLMNQISASVGPILGRIFFVTEDSDPAVIRNMMQNMVIPDPNGQLRFFETYEAAIAAVTTNCNDIIVLSANTTHSLAAGVALTKSRVHTIGLDGGDHLVQQGAKIQLDGAIATAYVLKNTGVRNTFKNIKFIQGSTNAAALTVVQDGGEGAVYKNCSFVFGVVNNLGGTTAHEFLAGSDSATFENCTFGSDTLLTSGARSVFHIDQVTAGQEFKSNILKNCNFLISSSSATATFIRLDAVGDILFSNLFIDCNFIASIDSAGGIAVAEAVQTGTGTVKGGLYFVRPASFNVTDFATATGGRNVNVQVVAAVSVAAAIEGIKPTA